jgi:hypothetical protein
MNLANVKVSIEALAHWKTNNYHLSSEWEILLQDSSSWLYTFKW